MTNLPFWQLVTKLNGHWGRFDAPTPESERPTEDASDEELKQIMEQKPEARRD